MRTDRRIVLASSILLLGLGTSVRGFEYEVLVLPLAPGDYPSFASAMNEGGTVVGEAGSPGFAWRWTAAGGMEVLPPPPSLTTYRATAVNDAGVVAGDGGLDWGEAWRYRDGEYEMLGTLPGDTMSTLTGINAAGEVTGTSQSPSLTLPRTGYLGNVDGVLTGVSPSSYATAVNDTGQVVGYYTSQSAFRYSPGVGVESLPSLPSHPLSWALDINSQGSVVGATSLASGNGLVPFLFTDAGGIREIGNFGDGAAAVSINDRGVLVGTFAAGGNFPFIWDEERGVRFLSDLVDPEATIILTTAVQIADDGRILLWGRDPVTFKTRPVILRPVGAVFADGFESGDLVTWSSAVE